MTQYWISKLMQQKDSLPAILDQRLMGEAPVLLGRAQCTYDPAVSCLPMHKQPPNHELAL